MASRVYTYFSCLADRMARSDVLRRLLKRTGLVGVAKRIYSKTDALLRDRDLVLDLSQSEVRYDSSSMSSLHLLNEKPIVQDFVASMEAEDTVWDIGANVGLFAVAAAIHTNGTVSAFDPKSGAERRIEANANRNDVTVNVYPIALGEKEDILAFDDSDGRLYSEDSSDVNSVEVVSGDQLISSGRIQPPDIMKIDVEGAEAAVLNGLSSLLQSGDCHTIVVEVHPNRLNQFDSSAQEVHDLLAEAGYEIEYLTNATGTYTIRATIEKAT